MSDPYQQQQPLINDANQYQQPQPGQAPPPQYDAYGNKVEGGYQQQYQQPYPQQQYQQPPAMQQNPDSAPVAGAYPSAVPEEVKDLVGNQVDVEKGDQVQFVRKVLGIVGAQMLVTCGLALASSAYESWGLFFSNIWVNIFAFILLLPVLCVLLCAGNIRKKVPVNYVLLFFFTFLMSVTIASLTAYLTVQSVIASIGVFAITTLSLFMAALCVKESQALMKFLIIGMLVAMIGYITLDLVIIFSWYNPADWVWTAYLVFAILLTGIYVIVDLVLIMKPGVFDHDDYILGAVMLYIDLVRMLLYIIIILGKRK